MKKGYFFIILVLLAGGAFYLFQTQNTALPDEKLQTLKNKTNEKKSERKEIINKTALPIPNEISVSTSTTPVKKEVKDDKLINKSEWKEYSNSNFDFTFKTPESWVQNGDIFSKANSNDKVSFVELNLRDKENNSFIIIKVISNPKGEKLYNFLINKFKDFDQQNSKLIKKDIVVSGQKAIWVSEILDVNGKGLVIDPAIKRTVVDFMNSKQTELIEIQHKALVTNKNADSFFSQFISNFNLDSK